MEICFTSDTIMQYGQDPTTVQVDYRVTRSLTMCRYYNLAQNAPLRWALSEGAIVPLPRGLTPHQQMMGKGIPWHRPTLKTRRCRCIENQDGRKSIRKNSEKWIEDAGLHNPLPHLYYFQGESRSKIYSLREADIEEN